MTTRLKTISTIENAAYLDYQNVTYSLEQLINLRKRVAFSILYGELDEQTYNSALETFNQINHQIKVLLGIDIVVDVPKEYLREYNQNIQSQIGIQWKQVDKLIEKLEEHYEQPSNIQPT